MMPDKVKAQRQQQAAQRAIAGQQQTPLHTTPTAMYTQQQQQQPPLASNNPFAQSMRPSQYPLQYQQPTHYQQPVYQQPQLAESSSRPQFNFGQQPQQASFHSAQQQSIPDLKDMMTSLRPPSAHQRMHMHTAGKDFQ
jgi:hypothetical protein